VRAARIVERGVRERRAERDPEHGHREAASIRDRGGADRQQDHAERVECPVPDGW